MSEREKPTEGLIGDIKRKIEKAGEIAGVPTRAEGTFSYYTETTKPKIEELTPEQLGYLRFLNSFLDEAIEGSETTSEASKED